MAKKPTTKDKSSKVKNKSNIKNKAKLAVDKQVIPRHREKYPALNFKRQVKTRLDQLDLDYIDQLNDTEKAWLNTFLEETVIANFLHKGKKLYKTKKARSEHYGSNNARNRCMYTKAKAMNTILNTPNPEALKIILEKEQMQSSGANDYEDALLTAITIKRNKLVNES